MRENLVAGEDFIHGEKTESLMTDLRAVILQLKETPQMLEVAAREDTIMKQWKVIFKHSLLEDVDHLKSVITRVCMASNSEAGCEQSNIKFNRSKNKLNSTMKLPMVKAHMRPGSNGQPLHLFNPEPVLQYWQENHHRLAQKTWVYR